MQADNSSEIEAETARRPAAFVILAAGKGTRMRSQTPKVLHQVAGLPMLGHLLRLAGAADVERSVVVVGHGAEGVSEATAKLAPRAVAASTVVQEPQLGTAHAAQQAEAALKDFEGDVYVLFADTPLIRLETIRRMAAARAEGAAAVVLGFEAANPTGYGRLLIDEEGGLERIVEEKDATDEQRAVTTCNSGVMVVDGARIWSWIAAIGDDNAKGEYYLTDLPALARRDGARVAVVMGTEEEVLGVNDRRGLAQAEAAFQNRARNAAMTDGVTLTAPETVFFAHDTRLARDVVVEPNVVFGPGVAVEEGATIRAFSHLEACRIGAGAAIGPYARLRGGADVGAKARIGNFVELKNARFGDGAKASHLSYVGDAEVGEGANIGAGTITCNYDGYMKHRTEIGAKAFIGSNTALVAPVTIGSGAVIAAGSTVTESVEADALAIGRARQTAKAGYAARLRDLLQSAADARRPSTPPARSEEEDQAKGS